MYASPCTNHDNCDLDLLKLRAAIKDLRSDDVKGRKIREDLSRLSEQLNSLSKKIPTLPPASDEGKAAISERARVSSLYWKTNSDLCKHLATRSSFRATVLYSIRAHHRGRLHRRKERLPNGEIRGLTLADQAALIDSYVDDFKKGQREGASSVPGSSAA